MCPPDGCLATGCVGSLVTDKQPVACGIDTVNADIGQTYTLTFVVRVAGAASAQSMEKVIFIFFTKSGHSGHLSFFRCTILRASRQLLSA